MKFAVFQDMSLCGIVEIADVSRECLASNFRIPLSLYGGSFQDCSNGHQNHKSHKTNVFLELSKQQEVKKESNV